jgi:hypothetical protein
MDKDEAQDFVNEMMARKPQEMQGEFEPGSDGAPTQEEVQSAAQQVTGERLNGAQVSALIGVITQYTAGTISEAAAINLIVSGFGMTEAEARKMLGLAEKV